MWKLCDVKNNRPPPMMIDVYIDADDLTNNQSLVIHDESGNWWDVEEAVRSFVESNDLGQGRTASPHVVVERWRIQLDEATSDMPSDLGAILPRVYKNSIVLFRSLYTYVKMLPAWRLWKRLLKPRAGQNVPKLRYRIYEGRNPSRDPTLDGLAIPLPYNQRQVTETYRFEAIDTPAGPFSVETTYRTNCDFRIENSEAILSSQFMDEDMFKPSLGDRMPLRDPARMRESGYRRTEAGSLPPARSDLAALVDQGQAYGSLSTFHHGGTRMSSSPLSALRAAREMNSTPSESPPVKPPPEQRSAQGSRSSLRSGEGAPMMGRRTSVSFMPFKTPSLSASPLQGDLAPAGSPRGSGVRTSALTALSEARNPTLNFQTTSQTRCSPVLPEAIPVPSSSSSSRPTPRYSSSFGHRRARLSVGGGKNEDDNNSSGKASVTSSNAQPGSGMLAEGGNVSSSSFNTDDDNISDFLKMLDQKKDLKSFQAPTDAASVDVSTRRTTAALTKYQRLRDSNAALSDSMSSSMMLHRSSSSSSRQLSSVPPMVAGTSVSTSSSPGERMSPRTPHTPAIPSRLSANSIIAYNSRERGTGRRRPSEGEEGRIPEIGGVSSGQTNGTGTDPIAIPTSPRTFHPAYRRSSSVAQQHRTFGLDEDLSDILPFGMRSASDGDERPPLSLSALVAMQDNPAVPVSLMDDDRATHGEEGVGMSRQRSSSSHEGRDDDNHGSGRRLPHRIRRSRGSGRGYTPPHGSNTSLPGDRGSGSAGSDQRTNRYSYTARTSTTFEDEEPLLFAMSDFQTGHQGRKSLDDGRAGPGTGTPDVGGSGESTFRRGSKRGGHGWA